MNHHDLTGFREYLEHSCPMKASSLAPRPRLCFAMSKVLPGDIYTGLGWLNAVSSAFPNSEHAQRIAYHVWQSWLFSRGVRNATEAN